MTRQLCTFLIVLGIVALTAFAAPASRSVVAAPTAGSFTVNSYADTNTADTVLTLREALLIARGGTGASGLNRALSNNEKAQMTGCTINASNFITGGCGAGIADTIDFSGLPADGTITLAAELPVIDDTQPTAIYGGAIAPTIDAHYFTNYGLRITSNGNTLYGIGARRAAISDFALEGDNNTLSFVWAWDASQHGVVISGNYNTVTDSRLGVTSVTDTVCNQTTDHGNMFNGIYITAAATHATVQYNYLGCNSSGVYIVSTNNAGNHTLGPGNRVGVNQSLAGNLGNTNAGLYVGAHNNVVLSNTVANNTYGVEITGDWVYVGGNTIRANIEAGVELHAWASNNSIGKLSLLGAVVSNTISSNLGHGILISDTAAPPGFNIIIGNQIGLSANGLSAAGNGGDGILVYGAHDTFIGGNGTQRNLIGSNAFSGVNLAGGAYNAHVNSNLIGINASAISRPNGADGVVVQGGAHDNTIGTAGAGNTIEHNAGNGVLLKDAATTANTVASNLILTNTQAGVALRANAHDNLVLTNTIRLNGNAGVLIDGGANSNRIGEYGDRAYGNVIGGNATDGIYISGATTRYNAIIGNNIGVTAAGDAADPNLHTGIALDTGTYGNIIGEYTTERNVIAGNAWDGVLLINGAHDNYVWGNDIGTNRDYPAAGQRPDQPTGGGGDYLALPNGGGVSIVGSFTNTVGGYIGQTDVANFISHNSHTGVYLSNAAHHNIIGSNLVSHNSDYGVLLDGGNTAYNTITRTLIFFNGLDGIGERNSAGFNVWTEVGVNDNGGLGIDKTIPNSPGPGDFGNVVHAPYLFFDSINKVTGVVQGHANASILGTVKIELYRVAPDASGYGEGAIFVGKTTTDGSGHWSITDTSPQSVRGCYVALVTESQLVIPFSSSEFSANTCRVMLPTVVR